MGLSAVQIVQNTSDNLMVYFPPNYFGGIGLLLIALICVVITVKSYDLTKYLFATLSPIMVFLALDLFAYHGTIILSRPTQTFTLEERSIYYKHTYSYPLGSLEQAIVKAGRDHNREMALLMSSGQEIALGGWDAYSSRRGMFQAAHAINAFLARNAQRSEF